MVEVAYRMSWDFKKNKTLVAMGIPLGFYFLSTSSGGWGNGGDGDFKCLARPEWALETRSIKTD